MTSNEIQIPRYENMKLDLGYQSFLPAIGPLACDRYALTMTYAAWKLGFAEERVTTSNVFCRSLLNNGDMFAPSEEGALQAVKIPYLVNAGLGLVAEWFDGWKFTDSDLCYLAQQNVAGEGGKQVRLFPNEFLFWLSKQRLTMDVHAIPEGQLIFPQEPSLRMTGLWWQQMMVEASVLELVSSSTNLATVATQMRIAAQREAQTHGTQLVEASAKSATLMEMALRRSSSIGALQSARAAYMAGWDSTSNDYAGKCYGIPVAGTFAHAWVMLHDTEEEAFENWAKVYPHSTVFLADTYNTLEGVKKAICICQKHGLGLKGIRLDSGDLASLSLEVRKLLDAAGYADARILATDSISVKTAASLFKRAGDEVVGQTSAVTGFGIGSEVAVNRNNPLLDFVMKLSARHADRSTGRDDLVRELIKLSETPKKSTLPGMIDVVRYMDRNGKWAGDTLIPADLNIGDGQLTRDLYSEDLRTGIVKPFHTGTPFIRLLKPWMKAGSMVNKPYADRHAARILADSRALCAESIGKLDDAHLLLPPDLPKYYEVGISAELRDKRERVRERIIMNRHCDRRTGHLHLVAA